MSLLRHSLCVLCLLLLWLPALAQTEEEIKENAEQLFENEQYVEATSLYLRLLSLNPRNADYNFRYGTCLLFNSNQKQEAIRYLNYAVNESGIDPRAFYFHGRALHLNYQFEDAKKSYQQYLQKRVKVDKRYDAEREMQMCDNGKKLLATFTDIVVTEKKEIEKEKFFRLYSNLQTIGGNILVSADFQSKMDKKMGHVPIVHFPPNAKAIYYSSYGDNGNNGLDIYIRRRLPDGSWGEPQLLPGAVNTPEDEDFPYMHPSGDYLYFSSKGHNSMGGYDVFYSLYDPDNNTFGRPENVDFAISSPDDDLFYVVDSLHRSAYFASARQSQNGKLHVYQVRVARVPIQEVIIMGDFISEINPENKEMNVTVTSQASGQEVGKIKTNAQGKYSFVFPRGGRYTYEVRVGGEEDVYKFVVEVPFLDEFRPLKQKALHTRDGDQEIVKIVNLFDEKVEGAEALIAEVIRKRAELDVNAGNFDLKELDAQSSRNEVLAEMGFRNMTMQEVSDQLGEMAMSEQLKTEQVRRIESNMNAEILAESEELAVIDEKINALRSQLATESDPARQHGLLEQIQQLEREKEYLANTIIGLNTLRDQAMNSVVKPSDSGIGKMEILENQFNALMSGNKEEEALNLLTRNKDVINKSRKESPEKVLNDKIAQSLALQEEIRTLADKQRNMEEEKHRLETELRTLQSQLDGAKKKDVERIQGEINGKEEELKMVNEVLTSLHQSLEKKNNELSSIDSQIATLQKALVADPVAEPTVAQVKQAVDRARKAEQALESGTTEKELAGLEAAHPELNPDYVAEGPEYATISGDQQKREAEILKDKNLSPEQKNEQLIAANETALKEIDRRLGQLNREEQQNGKTPETSEEISRLNTLKSDLTAKNEALESQTSVDMVDVATLQATHEAQLEEIQQQPGLSPQEKNAQKRQINESAIQQIDQRLETLKESGNSDAARDEQQKLEAWKEELKKENAGLEPVAVTGPDALELDANWQDELEALQKNASLTEEERLVRELEITDASLVKIRDRQQQIEDALREHEDPALEKEHEDLIALETRIVGQQQNWNTALKEVREAQLTEVAVSAEDVMEELVPGYQERVRSIESNAGLNEREKLTRTQEQDEQLRSALDKELNSISQALESTPEDAELTGRQDMLLEIKQETENRIRGRTQQIQTLDAATPVVSDAQVRDTLISETGPVTDEAREAAREGSAGIFEQEQAILELEVNHLNALRERQEEIEKEAERHPEDDAFQQQSRVIAQMVREQEQIVDGQKTAVLASIRPEQVEAAVNASDRTYSVEIGELEHSDSRTKGDDLANREDVLQERLQTAITEKEGALRRRYSVTAEMELAILRQAVSESERREEEARKFANVVVTSEQTQQEYVDKLRDEVWGTGENPLTANYTGRDELNAQEQMLAYYEDQLNDRISALNTQLGIEPDNEKAANEKEWLEEERNRVQTKRRQISVTLGELETQVVAQQTPADQGSDPELNRLNQQVTELRAELENPELSGDQRKELRAQLAEAEAQQVTRENEVLTSETASVQEENQVLTQQLENLQTGENGQDAKVEMFRQENQRIAQQLEAAEKARTPEERNYLLEQASSRQERVSDDLRVAVADEKRNDLETASGVQLLSREDLEQRRRSYTVEIGELNAEIARMDGEISRARKKEVPVLETERTALVSRRDQLELNLREVEQRLSTLPVREAVASGVALDKQLTFNEERKTAASETYEDYYKLAEEALAVEQQIVNLEKEIQQERDQVNSLLSVPGSSVNDEEIRMGVARITKLQSEIDRLSIELVQRKYAADQVLPADPDEAMKMQNLVLRGVQPIKTAVVATALIQMPSNGFAIRENTESIYSAENPIPVGVSNPKGLVYRVQVGAFAKPIPQDLFKEFNPVSGEKIEGTNVTRYMAGFFNNSDAVVNAREQIRALGYADAFVVAYCDGERIQFGEAKRREQEGTCVPKGTNEMLMEVSANTAEKLGIPTTNEVTEVPEYSYHQAPGAAKADPIEMKQGLFFTVQIGVFNRPVGPEYTYGMEELLTIRLPNGQIRYASGVFNSVEEALPRRDEALNKGVKGAFVTAYFKGERISLAEARRLLAEMGPSILQSEMDRQQPVKPEITDVPVVNDLRTDTVQENSVVPVKVEQVDQRIQIVSRKQFETFPRDVLNRYNAEGTFFYDEKDKRVKSIVYKEVDDLPRLWNFRNDIDTVYISADELFMDTLQIIEVKFPSSLVSGDFADWLMRFNYRKEFSREGEGLTVRIYGIEPNRVSEVQGIVRKFGLEAKAIEGSELEIQMEEK